MHGLGSLCWGVQEQLYRLRPEVMVHSLEVAQRLAPVPDAADDERMLRCGADEACAADADEIESSWRVVLSYAGEPTPLVMEQAKRGRVRLIDARCTALTEEAWAVDRLIDRDDWLSRATRLARYTVPRCWVPHNPGTHVR